MTATASWFCNDFSHAVFGILVIVICLIFGACVLEFRLLQYGEYIFDQNCSELISDIPGMFFYVSFTQIGLYDGWISGDFFWIAFGNFLTGIQNN